MQQTRLNSLFTTAGSRLTAFFGNPWRRISLILISLLLGVFMGAAISTTAGQTAIWDVTGSALLVFWVEWMSRIAYRRQEKKSFWIDVANMFKVGIIYSLFLEAFKVGS
jgi:uncharacterized membrane protein YoaK (UPF0700 family)